MGNKSTALIHVILVNQMVKQINYHTYNHNKNLKQIKLINAFYVVICAKKF